MWFASYLQEKHNDSYGWNYMKKFYLPSYPGKVHIEVYCLKPFLNSSYKEEATEILRNLARHNDIALEYLAEFNDPQTETLAINMSLNNPNSYRRSVARNIIKSINLDSYITTLKTSLDSVTDDRIAIYDELLKSGQPSVYKYVLDIFKSNQFPYDSSIIMQELENDWLFYPSRDISVSNLLDSLSSALYQFNSFGWFGNLNFVNDINSLIQNSKSYYLINDTISSVYQLKLFRNEIDQELRDSTDLINDFIKVEAYKYLFPRAYFIEERIIIEKYNDTLTSITPSSVIAGSPTTIARITGGGFNNYTHLFWNENYYLDYSIISPTEINVTIPENFLSEVGENKIDANDSFTDYSNSLTFTVSQQSNPNLLVSLKNSTGTLLTNGTLQYYEGSWRDAVNNGDGTFTVITTIPTVSIRVYYEYASQQVDNVPAQNNTYTFTTVNAAVQLKNSLGSFIDVGTIQYYAGAWRSFGTTSNGVAYKELLPINYSFRMTYEYGSIDKQQNLSTDPIVVFQTVNAAVQLKNSLGSFIDVGTVQYYAGAWRSFGTTSNGVVYKELLPINYSFRMTYEYGSIDKQQNLSLDPTVVFQTVNAAVQLKNSLGNLIDLGTVQYYAGAWRSFGTTSNGVAYKELLPVNYSFRMTYEYGSIDKQQNLSTDPIVVFQTVNAAVQLKNSLGSFIDVGTVQYYAGAWRSFGTTSNGVAYKELLPVNYSFRMTYEYVSKDMQQNLSTNPVVDFTTVLCTVKVSNTNNQPLNNADVKYYAGAWKDLGITNINGITTKELLPANLSFRATYGNISLDKQQDISVNNFVEILLNVP